MTKNRGTFVPATRTNTTNRYLCSANGVVIVGSPGLLHPCPIRVENASFGLSNYRLYICMCWQGKEDYMSFTPPAASLLSGTRAGVGVGAGVVAPLFVVAGVAF